MTHQAERRRIRTTKSKIYSHNDKWNQQIAQRKGEEATLSALLEDIRTKVQGGENAESLHGLEKKLAAAQNWVVTPPSVKDAQFKVHAAPTSPIGWDGPMPTLPMLQ